MGTSAGSSSPSKSTTSAGMRRTGTDLMGYGYVQTQMTTADTTKNPGNVVCSAKRRRLSTPNMQRGEEHSTQAQSSAQASGRQMMTTRGDTTAVSTQRAQITSRSTNLGTNLSGMNRPPSTVSMSKPSDAFTLSCGHIPVLAAHPLSTGNLPQDDATSGLPSPHLTTPESATATDVEVDPHRDEMQFARRNMSAPFVRAQRPLSTPAIDNIESDNEDSINSNLLVGRTSRRGQQASTPLYMPTSAVSSAPNPARHSVSATEKSDHLLIFLKEVKKLKWADITEEFAKDIPGRSYVQLQSRYSQIVNKRDRTQDPPTLNLPARFAAEAAIDWVTVHANTEGPRGPRVSRKTVNPNNSQFPHYNSVGRPRTTQHVRDDDSSSTDSAPQRQRARRAPPVNYTWSKLRTTAGGSEDLDDEEEAIFNHTSTVTTPARSESPTNKILIAPGVKPVVYSRPLDMNFQVQDAKLGMGGPTDLRYAQHERMPYLSSTQRLSMRNEPHDRMWDQHNIQDWQGTVLHVDFSPAELQIVEKIIKKIIPSETRHSTYQRHLRAVLKDLSSPKLQKLVYEIRRHLRSRDTQSVAAFLEDAAAGMVSDIPQIRRLAMIEQSTKFSSVQSSSVSSITRNRELGLRSKRGWHVASTPMTYQLKNQMMDTLGPKYTWTGASSDIHTVAWSPDGQYFAAGAVAVTDSDSMQYNRPNVLMYGDTTNGNIHELGEHSIVRPKTEAGANSTHAMFVSQDPKLYTTVTSVAFSSSGDLMYSAGYDKSVCIWDVTADSRQPQMVRQLQHKAPVDVLAVNPVLKGNIATATKRTTNKSIKLVFFNEETIHEEEWVPNVANFASAKALNRPDLNMSPNALKFDSTGRLLLAGFGANMHEDSGLDTSGDICLWDVETQAALQVYGSSRNVFDVTFNPALGQQGLFAVGCVANGNVNRGTRSVVRFYSVKQATGGSSVKFTCPIELECKAFDMNDVVWCPYDENLFASGCTDGRSYVWDLRRPDRVLYTLSHGTSLMPLQDGVPHERTDTGVRFLSWGQNARRLYSGSSDGTVKVWDVAHAKEDVFIKDLITANSGIMSGAFTSDFSKLIIGEVNGTANVLEIGRNDVALSDTDQLQYQPYLGRDDEESAADMHTQVASPVPTDTGAGAARTWLNTDQLRLVPAGGLPKQQVVQGPKYRGPYDLAEDGQSLRDQALAFQLNMAMITGPQCSLPHCAENMNTTTQEEIGDSGRSKERIPDELRQQWLNETPRIVLGKSKCTYCSRPAIPSTDVGIVALCERCSFTCFRCGRANYINGSNTTLTCNSCGGVWDIGALGYECVQQPHEARIFNVPMLKGFGRESYLERLEDVDTTFGDEINALTDFYFGLAIDRPESPLL